MLIGRRSARAGLVLLSVIAALLLVEGGARILFRIRYHRTMPEAFFWMDLTPGGPRLMPNVHAEIFATVNRRVVRLDTNSLGFRGPELRPVPGKPRVLFLGDSVLFGPGLEEPETIVGQMRARRPVAELQNAAVPGLGTREEVDLLAEVWPRTRPDAAVLCFYLNDSRRSVFLDEQQGSLPFAAVQVINRLRRSSMVVNQLWSRILATGVLGGQPPPTDWIGPFAARGWVSDRGQFDRVIAQAADDFGAAWRDESWPGVEVQLRRFDGFCAAHHVRPLLVVFPVSLQVETDFEDRRPQERVVEICRRLSIPCLDLLPVLRARRQEKLFLDHCHLNPRGAALAAAEIDAFLAREGLFP